MEESLELGNYLPLSFKTRSEQDYIQFLWEAFESNYANGKYQFAFLAYHMLTMSFVYFNIWQIRQTVPDDFKKALIGFSKDIEKNLLDATSPFAFSTVNERTILLANTPTTPTKSARSSSTATTYHKRTSKSAPPSIGGPARNWRCTPTPPASSPSTKPSAPPTPRQKQVRHRDPLHKDAKHPFKIVIVREGEAPAVRG